MRVNVLVNGIESRDFDHYGDYKVDIDMYQFNPDIDAVKEPLLDLGGIVFEF
jgi:hypothetical protein